MLAADRLTLAIDIQLAADPEALSQRCRTVTDYTRAAKLCLGSGVPAELLGALPHSVGHLPTVKEKLHG